MTQFERAQLIALFVIAVATALLFARPPGRVAGPRSPQTEGRTARYHSAAESVPAGSELVVTANFDRLRELGFGQWRAAAERELGGVGKLSELCRFDPVAALRELAVTVSAGNDDELGFVATGDFSADALGDCASRVITRRGGQPTRGRMGSFLTLSDPAHPGWGEIAVRDGGPVLLGRGTHLRDLIDATEGRKRTLDRDAEHTELRRALGPGGAVLASWVPRPGSARAWLGDTGMDTDALDALRGAALRVGADAGLSVETVLGCPDPKTCRRLEEQVGALGRKLVAPWLEAWLGWSPDPAKSELEPNRVRVHWRLDAEQTKSVLRLLADLFGPRN
jgi:hypothetical protein